MKQRIYDVFYWEKGENKPVGIIGIFHNDMLNDLITEIMKRKPVRIEIKSKII